MGTVRLPHAGLRSAGVGLSFARKAEGALSGGKNRTAQPVGHAWVIFQVDFFYSALFYSALFYSALFYSALFYSAVFYSSTLATSGQRNLLLMSALRNSSSTSSSSCRRTMAISLISR